MSPAARSRLIRLGVAIGAGLGLLFAASHSGVWASEIDANGNPAPKVIGRRPAECPHRWCGCGLARYLGLNDKRLYRAWSWATLFPRTHAKVGAAAVRRHHVMLLERHIAGTKWLVRDFNGGRGLAWLHVRDVRGYVFVEPGSMVGALQ